MNFSIISINLLIINGFVLSIGVMQKVLDFNLFPKNVEDFAYGIIFCFEIFVFLLYLVAILYEIRQINTSLKKIAG